MLSFSSSKFLSLTPLLFRFLSSLISHCSKSVRWFWLPNIIFLFWHLDFYSLPIFLLISSTSFIAFSFHSPLTLFFFFLLSISFILSFSFSHCFLPPSLLFLRFILLFLFFLSLSFFFFSASLSLFFFPSFSFNSPSTISLLSLTQHFLTSYFIFFPPFYCPSSFPLY